MATNTQQELIDLSAAPLHGVCIEFSATHSTLNSPYKLTTQFSPVTINTTQQPIWQLLDEGERYHSQVCLYHNENGFQLSINCEGQGRFELKENQLTIDWQPTGTGPAHYLQTFGISLYLELKGHLCLHANTLIKNNQAHLFLAPSRTGKSTLTSLLSTHSYTLITDDMAAVYQSEGNFHVYPSWAKVRLWPDSAKLIANQLNTEQLQQKRVHERFSKQEITFTPQFTQQATPIKAMFYLNRIEAQSTTATSGEIQVVIEKIPPSIALIILLQNSMLGDAYRALQIEKQRTAALAQLLKAIPFYKVTYPSGLEKLPEIAQQLNQQIQEL